MYGNSLPGYDAWLEQPYTDAARRAAAAEAAVEELGLSDEEADTFDYDAYLADREADEGDRLFDEQRESRL